MRWRLDRKDYRVKPQTTQSCEAGSIDGHKKGEKGARTRGSMGRMCGGGESDETVGKKAKEEEENASNRKRSILERREKGESFQSNKCKLVCE